MKHLSDYMEAEQTKLFSETGSFFAFGSKQFNEQKKEGEKYVNMGTGLLCPEQNVERLINSLDEIYKKAIAQDISENGKKGIIHRELANHECQITHDYSAIIENMREYGIEKIEIATEWPIYFSKCVENDWF